MPCDQLINEFTVGKLKMIHCVLAQIMYNIFPSRIFFSGIETNLLSNDQLYQNLVDNMWLVAFTGGRPMNEASDHMSVSVVPFS